MAGSALIIPVPMPGATLIILVPMPGATLIIFVIVITCPVAAVHSFTVIGIILLVTIFVIKYPTGVAIHEITSEQVSL
jgi:hypothetical protein